MYEEQTRNGSLVARSDRSGRRIVPFAENGRAHPQQGASSREGFLHISGHAHAEGIETGAEGSGQLIEHRSQSLELV